MNDFPLRNIEIEDFRKLNGSRSYALDAPIVLIHGPNGSGKTSILSALELGLTGQIRGIDDGDDEQFGHLPYTEAQAATVRVDVAPELNSRADNERLSVSRTRGFTGPFALSPDAARFYRERCYLDQASLGRLLELYQETDKDKESALARFVNELLGLEEVDALIDGLFDATHLARLRNRAPELGAADQNKKDASVRLSERTRTLKQAQEELTKAKADAFAELRALQVDLDADSAIPLVVARASEMADDSALQAEKEALEVHLRELLDLGGQLSAVRELDSASNLDDASERAFAAESTLAAWQARHQPDIDAWDADAEALGLEVGPDSRLTYVLSAQMTVERTLKEQATLQSRLDANSAALAAARMAQQRSQTDYDAAKEIASSLVEGLVALRPYISEQDGQVCPVCDRDYSQIGDDLGAHVDHKIEELSEQSERLQNLRVRRDTAVGDLSRLEAEEIRIASSLMPTEQVAEAVDRAVALQDLLDRLASVSIAINEGRELSRSAAAARSAHRDLEGAANVRRHVAERLRHIEAALKSQSSRDMSVSELQQHLVDRAAARIAAVTDAIAARNRLATAAARLANASDREAEASRLVSDANQDQDRWAERVAEGVRRQGVAKDLHAAATAARSIVIQRVFTNELNGLWRDLFTRLAPRETYVPAFGTVTTNKTVEPKLVTRHRSGTEGGTPRLMLSQGNLNTAALSLFLALHLSVRDAVGCLVFDDPVQAMDEVHIAQFAALIRTLSKDLGRQVVIAVHERELFDYLSLELSPAFEGDELITIRLGEEDAPQGGWHRDIYQPDDVIAV